jgi:diphosphomevalonate decarboxylase
LIPPDSNVNTDPRSLAARLLPASHSPASSADAIAPANIALCKYWGKRNDALKLPVTGSLSASLGSLGTRMSLAPASHDSLRINGRDLPSDDKAFTRLFAFFDLLRPPGLRLAVDSENTIPMAAGLASSASAFAAAVLALDRLLGWRLDRKNLSILARLGSGSACRSVHDGFVEWHAGTRDDGMDSHAEALAPLWPDFRIGIVTVSAAEKPVGSSEGMKRTLDTARLYDAWPAQVAQDLPRIRQAVFDHDFSTLGRCAEQNALAMHATMIAAWPPILYWQPETLATLHKIHALRRDGLELYATLDAGPNVKLLFLEPDQDTVLREFSGLLVAE